MRADRAVYVPPEKDTFFFDREFERGLLWYSKFFDNAGDLYPIEISHDYFFHPLAPSRVCSVLGGSTKVALILRKPSDWIVSVASREMTLGMHRGLDIDSVLDRSAGLISAANFVPPLRSWLEVFGIHVRVFFYDDLVADSMSFYRQVSSFFGYESTLSAVPGRVNSARHPRFPLLARAGKAFADYARNHGRIEVVGSLKRQSAMTSVLFGRPVVEQADASMVAALDSLLSRQYDELSEIAGRDLKDLWGG